MNWKRLRKKRSWPDQGTDRRKWDARRSMVGVSGAVRGTVYWGRGLPDFCWQDRQTVVLVHKNSKYKAFRVACSEKVRCVNARRMNSCNSSIATTLRACAVIAVLVGIISWSVDRIILTFSWKDWGQKQKSCLDSQWHRRDSTQSPTECKYRDLLLSQPFRCRVSW